MDLTRTPTDVDPDLPCPPPPGGCRVRNLDYGDRFLVNLDGYAELYEMRQAFGDRRPPPGRAGYPSRECRNVRTGEPASFCEGRACVFVSPTVLAWAENRRG